jgi:hypothetical protein
MPCRSLLFLSSRRTIARQSGRHGASRNVQERLAESDWEARAADEGGRYGVALPDGWQLVAHDAGSGCSNEGGGMSGFDSLTLALESWFATPLGDMPDLIRHRVEDEFAPMPWDQLSADQRQTVTLQLDYQHDPATEQDRQFWWDHYQRQDELKAQIAQWEATAAPTAGDLALRETRLKELRQELTRTEMQERQSRGDYYPERKPVGGESATSPASQRSAVRYVAYPKAMAQLRKRLDATPTELAAWIWCGPKDGGIAAYVNANELDPPPRFYFGVGSGKGDDHDCVSPLMACWFRDDELAGFKPVDRFITGEALVKRWAERPGLRADAWVRAKIRESRLQDMHPLSGLTQGSCPEDASLPPMAAGLFWMSEVEAIEAEDFADDQAENTSAANSAPAVEGVALSIDPVITAVSEARRAALSLPNVATGLLLDPVEKKPVHITQASKSSDSTLIVINETSIVPTPPTELKVGSPEWRMRTARAAANALHDKPGGSRDKQTELRKIWASGKYSDRNACAEQECGALGMAFSTARKALANTPDPDRS